VGFINSPQRRIWFCW